MEIWFTVILKYLPAVEALDEKGNFLGRDTAIVWKLL